MSEDKYQVVFGGNITGEYPLDVTVKRFAKYFKLSDSKAKQLFSGDSQIIKSDLTEEAAMTLAMAIATVGCECVIELMTADQDISRQPGFVERRKVADRRVKTRRKAVRGSALRPDRRKNNGRRLTDKN